MVLHQFITSSTDCSSGKFSIVVDVLVAQDKSHSDMVNYLDKINFCERVCGIDAEDLIPAMEIIRDATSKAYGDLFEYDEKIMKLNAS